MSNYKVITGSIKDMPELVFQSLKPDAIFAWVQEVLMNKITFDAICQKLHEEGWLFFDGIDSIMKIKNADVKIIDKSFMPICILHDKTLTDEEIDKIVAKVNGLC
jgi:hypothetical protein